MMRLPFTIRPFSMQFHATLRTTALRNLTPLNGPQLSLHSPETLFHFLGPEDQQAARLSKIRAVCVHANRGSAEISGFW